MITNEETRMANIGPPTSNIEWSPIPDPEFKSIPDPEFKSGFDEKGEWRDFYIVLGISVFSVIIMIFSVARG